MLFAYRAVLALIPLAAIPLVEVSGQVTVRYDEIRDFTSATSDTIELMHPVGKVGTGVQLQAMFVCHGDTLCQPGRVTLQFQVQSYYGWRFLRYHDLVLLADTVRINLGELDHDGRVGTGYVLEFMNTDIAWGTFEVLATAQRVRGALGATEFELGFEQRAALRELVQTGQQN